MEKEYNLLTKELLAEGYTVDNFPDYVRICTSRFSGDNPLFNLAGGFEYLPTYRDEFVYKTGCGMYVKGSHVLSDMSYMGIDWSHENNCPVIRCPYDNADCPDNDERLHGLHGGGLCIQCWCVCHKAQEIYDYENSLEKANKERKDEIDRKYKEYVEAHHGRVCRNHMGYDERTRTWSQYYEPSRCAKICYSQDGYCPILGKQLNKKRGNVYYDLKTSCCRHDDTIFNGDQLVFVEKGNRYFERPVSMDICEAFIKVQSGDIYERLKRNLRSEQFFDKSYSIEVLNIRAESKPSRDLLQDLQDIKDGIQVTHATDVEKLSKSAKKEQRQITKQKKIEKLEKKILEIGYENFKELSLDKIHADKWISEERIEELENIRKQKMKEEQEKPVQLSLFDL